MFCVVEIGSSQKWEPDIFPGNVNKTTSNGIFNLSRSIKLSQMSLHTLPLFTILSEINGGPANISDKDVKYPMTFCHG